MQIQPILVYFWVKSATRPPFWILPPPFLHILDPPLPPPPPPCVCNAMSAATTLDSQNMEGESLSLHTGNNNLLTLKFNIMYTMKIYTQCKNS